MPEPDKQADAKAVEAEVVEGPPPHRMEGPAARTFYHPLSGAVILGLDWLAFGTDMLSGLAATLLTSAAVFIVTFLAVQAAQIRLHGDPPGRARLKALIGAAAAGVPFPITGTLLGAAILLLSGLSSRRRE